MIPQRRPRRFAWLGLFAMAMAFVAPVVSQALAAHHVHRHEHHHDGMTHSLDKQSSVSNTSQITQTPHWVYVWEKCGYCDLLFNNPPLSSEFVIRPPRTLYDSPVYLGLAARGFARLPVFIGAMTRAPPAGV